MKNNYILGISAFYHDSAAALLKDGEIIAAAQEERFTRKKHDPGFPLQSVDFCLGKAGIGAKDLSLVCFYDKPLLKFERILETHMEHAPFSLVSFMSGIPPWVKQKLFIKDIICQKLFYEGRIIFPEHHHSHAASAFYPSPFAEAAILTVDGVGEWTTTSFGRGKANSIELLEEIKFPHSLGLLYSAFTYYCGFRVNSGEYKLMGLAPYGEPIYKDIILKNLIEVKDDGSFRLNMKYFNYCTGLSMINRKFTGLFGTRERKPQEDITQFYMDIASSIQEVTEEVIIKMARHVRKSTGMENLCMAGGVALNCVANGKIINEGIFKDIWVQPAASDAGGALGAAFIGWHEFLGNARVSSGNDRQKSSLLGPDYSDEQIEQCLKDNNVVYTQLGSGQVAAKVAELLRDQYVVGLFQGRMEYGPRALGARSIIGDPRSMQMQSLINRKIKFRESFRPFAPSVLREKSAEYFEFAGDSPYMLVVSNVLAAKRMPVDPGLKGLEKLKAKRSEFPAVTHVDYSARLHTVSRQENPLFYDIINCFNRFTGCPMIINTSFNVRGEPIVQSPLDALRCFLRTDMDYLVLGSFVIAKQEQDAQRVKLEEVNEFELD